MIGSSDQLHKPGEKKSRQILAISIINVLNLVYERVIFYGGFHLFVARLGGNF